MNCVDVVSVYRLVVFAVFWIHGLTSEIPPERCYLFELNATTAFHEDNKQPSKENINKVMQILILPHRHFDFPCNGTSVTIKQVTFSSKSSCNKTNLDLVFNIEPYKNTSKVSAYQCAYNMASQASTEVQRVELLLKFREDNASAPYYLVHEKSCCKEQHPDNVPCCRAGYTLKNQSCVNDQVKGKVKSILKKGEVVKMKEDSEEKCKSSGLSVGIIIIIACSSLVVFVSILLVGFRVWKFKRCTNNYNVHDEENGVEPDERRNTNEIPYTVNVPIIIEESKDGYVPMKNLSRANLSNDNSTNSNTINNNDDKNAATTLPVTQDSPKKEKQSAVRPLSRSVLLFDFDKHIPLEAIEFTHTMLGRGQFGQVELANVTIKGIKRRCAVKMIRGRGTQQDEKELFEELQILYSIPEHPNVVNLLGGCMEDNSPLFVVVEYCANGSLLKYLQSNRTSSNEYVNFSGGRLDFRWKLNRAIEICEGMIFLAQQQVIHRDLAARNILLDENEVAKISDFGMAKDVYLSGLYLKETSGFLPVRWMAIEAIDSSIYSIKSDVWSFGVLLWELYMDARLPYPCVSDGSMLLLYLQKGYRMAQPENCPDALYHLMERCWLEKPDDRPSFTQVNRELVIIKEDETRRQSEASRRTEISDDLPSSTVFEDEMELESLDGDTREHQEETHTPLETAQVAQDGAGIRDIEIDPIEIGILNRGRSSIDSGASSEIRRLSEISFC